MDQFKFIPILEYCQTTHAVYRIKSTMKLSRIHSIALIFTLALAFPYLFSPRSSIYAQLGNTVNGFVYGLERRPIADADVELLDEFHRTRQRVKTNGMGYYSFNDIGFSNVTVRVMPSNNNYEEQEELIEIGSRAGGVSIYQKDFHLKLRKGVDPAAVAIFVQDIPKAAKELYDAAAKSLHDKQIDQGRAQLRSAIEIFPKFYYALELLAKEYVSMDLPEAYAAAEVLFANAVDVNPRGSVSWYGLAYSRYSLKKYDGAQEAVKKALEVNSSYADAHILAGILNRRSKKYSEAERSFLKANDLLSKKSPRIHWELALLYGNDLKRYADAANELKLFLKLQPEARDAEKIKRLIADFESKARP